MRDALTDMLLLDALARRVRVCLIDKPREPNRDGRLTTRLLAADPAGRLVLDVPRDADGKVFIPVGTLVGLAFSLGRAFVQARTTIHDHCQYALVPTRRVDTIVVDRPDHVIFGGYREHVRKRVPEWRCIPVTLWRFEGSAAGELVRDARLLDQSPSGLGIRVAERLSWPEGANALIRIEDPEADENRFYQATLVHCSPDPESLWVAGFGNVMELKPGSVPGLAQLIGAAAQTADG